MRVAIYTLGCKVNQYETQAMEQELRRRGHELVDFEDSADAYIVNTCSVTAVSDKKSRQMIRRARKQAPGAVVAVCGCYAQTAPEAVRTKLELGDGYGMRGASALGKEWYEHSAGYCSYLKGKTEAEAASIPADGSDPDLAALCTISIDALQKAVGDAFENAGL